MDGKSIEVEKQPLAYFRQVIIKMYAWLDSKQA
jgi:hypothetical protein